MKKIFVLFLIITLLVLPVVVYATNDNSDDTDGGDNGTCTGDGCNNHYNTGASGFRISLVDKNGNLVAGTRAYDYWFDPDNTEARWNQGSNDYCLNKKYTKQQIMGKSNVPSLVVSCSKDFPDAANLVSEFGTYYDPQNVDKAIKKLVSMAKEAENDINHSNWNVYNKIFKDINFKANGKYKTVATFTSYERNNYFFQFEPLISFKNGGSYVTDSIFYGTINELLNLGVQQGISNGGSMKAFNYYIVAIMAINHYIGVVAPENNMPINFYRASKTKNINGYDDFFETYGSKYYAYGVAYLYMDDVLPKCNPDADLVVEDYTKFLDKDGKKATSQLDAWRKLVEKYTEIQTSFKSTVDGKINAFNPDVITIMKGSNVLSPDTHKYIGSATGYPSNSQFAGVRCNVTYSCQEMADTIYHKYYNSNKEDYEKYIRKLQQAYPSFQLLKTGMWQELGYTGPKCDNQDIGWPCEPSYEKGQCESGKDIFSYGDANDNRCWTNGIAYKTDDVIQSSIYQRMSNGCYTYCKQTVTYNFPLDVTKETKAGTVFKWGTTTAQNIFGTMNVNMTCTIGRPEKTTTNCQGTYTIGQSGLRNVKLLDENSTSSVVKIIYNEPSSNLDINEGNITTKLVESTKNRNSIVCNDAKCSNKPVFNLSAKYNLEYTDNKLMWYSYKADGSLVDKNNYDDSKEEYYYEIGYGLPTSFTTATGTYGDNKEMTGRLTNPGTKNVVSQVDKGHFTRLLKEKEGKEYLDYSCKFKVKNQLYEDECEYDELGNLINGSPEYCPEVKDIDVVFRTVQLVDKSNAEQGVKIAFPGRAGTSRTIGMNWWESLKEEDGTITATDSDKIARIAEILDYSVYSEDHLQYKITLNSGLIREIRGYNKDLTNSKINPYSAFIVIDSTHDEEILGYSGYTCVERGGKKHCTSHLISKLANDGKMTGKCVEGNKRNSFNRAKENIDGC